MIIAATDEGVHTLRSLSERLEEGVCELSSTTAELSEAFEAHYGALGPHAASIRDIIADMIDDLSRSLTPAATLAAAVRDVADAYQDVIDSDPYHVASKGSVSALPAKPPIRSRAESSTSAEQEVGRRVVALSKTTQQTVKLPGGGTLYDSPAATGGRLNSDQGTAVAGMEGTCGLASCENIARMAGKDVTEADVIAIARAGSWCVAGSKNPGENGGTSPKDRRAILSKLGIESVLDDDTSIEHIASEVEAGKGVIVSVLVERFWPDAVESGLHAVVITSVERDADGSVSAVYVCDSGHGDAARRVPQSTFVRALTPGKPCNVTKGPIR